MNILACKTGFDILMAGSLSSLQPKTTHAKKISKFVAAGTVKVFLIRAMFKSKEGGKPKGAAMEDLVVFGTKITCDKHTMYCVIKSSIMLLLRLSIIKNFVLDELGLY
jgi:hypothetical protein